jgi:hypothetical protein
MTWDDFVRKWKDRECHGFDKYFNKDACLLRKEVVVDKLQLNDGVRRRILDISTGFGFFPYLCKRLGHEVVLTDCIDAKTQISVEARAVLGLPHAIHFKYDNRKYKPLPFLGVNFHVITALACSPHSGFGIDDWCMFLENAFSHLMDDGFVYVEPNLGSGMDMLLKCVRSHHKGNHFIYHNRVKVIGVKVWKNVHA